MRVLPMGSPIGQISQVQWTEVKGIVPFASVFSLSECTILLDEIGGLTK
ncbi:hypothetical protein SOV_48220 [Sporomusa ovata DSM 2662]|uniref:Uncharacterized protein n=1 Tax=Sporomusa ovata TaxID=2378 RepID=A0A0U1L128_9FIRM|nr:hypothetical protein SOV_2c00910 [Sporomusa ovata DSM 2662]CQR73039.1 hypothetical protein SpAn4DRAFT_2271 [Sporomusa ovata]